MNDAARGLGPSKDSKSRHTSTIFEGRTRSSITPLVDRRPVAQLLKGMFSLNCGTA